MGEIFKRFSSCGNQKKFVSWMLRYPANLRKAIGSRITKEEHSLNIAVVPISVDEMRNSEMKIVKNVQKKHFHDELSHLVSISGESKKILTVKKSSQLYRLDPVMEDDIIRVGGRFLNSPLSEESKHPIILSKESPVSQLTALHFHYISGHSGLEHVLSLIRQRFWIKARFPLGDFFRATRSKNNNSATGLTFFSVRTNKFAKWKTGLTELVRC